MKSSGTRVSQVASRTTAIAELKDNSAEVSGFFSKVKDPELSSWTSNERSQISGKIGAGVGSGGADGAGDGIAVVGM